MMSPQKAENIAKWLLLILLALTGICYYFKNKLPPPSFYDLNRLMPPIQTSTDKKPFDVEEHGYHYTIYPKFDYALDGVVVSYSDVEDFGQTSHHRRWKDFINPRDFCVIWGGNVSTGIYRKMDFTNGTFTCYAQMQKGTPMKFWSLFKDNELSNNHVLATNAAILKQIRNAEIGDHIHFRGVLAEYKNNDTGGTRGTSITREDSANGACETIFLDDFYIVKKAHPTLRAFYDYLKWLTLLAFIIYAILFATVPLRRYGDKNS